jgi:O-antigen/teichoic acid export membrane protein
VLSREARIVLVFSGAQLGLGLVSTRLLTQLADPESLGEFYLYMNLAAWLALPTASSYLYIWKNWTVARATGRERSLARSIGRGLALQTILCGLGAIAMLAAGLVKASAYLIVALAVAASAQSINQALDQVQALERSRVVAGVLGLLATPIRQLGLAAGAFFIIRATGSSLLGVQALYGAATAALTIWLFSRTLATPYTGERPQMVGSSEEPFVSLPRYLRFSVPFLVTGLATQASASAERWGLALRSSPQATALFVQALGLALAATNAATLPIGAFLTPIISQAAASAPDDPLRAARRPIGWFVALSAAALALCTAAAAVLSGPVTTIFFGPRFRAIQELLPWAVLGQSLFILAQALWMVPIAIESTAGAAAAFAASRVVYLALLVLVPCHGSCALWFSQCLVVANLIYLLSIVLVASRATRLASRKRTA